MVKQPGLWVARKRATHNLAKADIEQGIMNFEGRPVYSPIPQPGIPSYSSITMRNAHLLIADKNAVPAGSGIIIKSKFRFEDRGPDPDPL